ncbi:YidB family protein [Telmatobacter sp. DSM 110680]|uniref:YidB family protein n=1 Tax=Telmatobacter sp. DSM 110680 TaxID=3036704 RepID=A0AAU7DCX7_9BACT
MSILNTVESMAMGNAGPEHAQVAGGLMEELQNQPGGIGGLIQNLQRNGMGPAVEQWSQGQTQPNPSAIENGLAGTGIIANIAQRTGLSEGVVRGSLAVVIPLVVSHVISNNHVSPTGEPTGTQPESGSILQSVLQRIL